MVRVGIVRTVLKRLFPVTLAFDCEWIPDAPTIRRVLGLSGSKTDIECIERAWSEVRTDAADRQPFLKVILCRIVSVCGVVRKETNGKADLTLVTLPPPAEAQSWDEARIIRTFLSGVGRNQAQLVGYNCLGSDMPALTQRAMVHGISSPEFGKRPEKPWEGSDYFSSFSDHVFDIGKVVSFGRTMPSLHQAAAACGIPGKMEISGDQVFDLWREKKYAEIVEYNVFDALTTYLLWLRCAYFSGLFSDGAYQGEMDLVMALLEREISKGGAYLGKYRDRWLALRGSAP